jgi:hypothetical protein|nr:MAG TPA: hypothetical protein [Caudoviricetes sp.]
MNDEIVTVVEVCIIGGQTTARWFGNYPRELAERLIWNNDLLRMAKDYFPDAESFDEAKRKAVEEVINALRS